MLRFWKRLNDLYGRLVIVVFGLVMLIGLWQVYDNYYTFSHALDDSILKYKPDPDDPSAMKDSPITDEMVAWLTIDGTNIDYPVMQGDDNTKFLNTDPFGNYSLSGSIFLDSRCSPDFSDGYSVIYGHHMEYGHMFGALDDYLNPEYLKSHSSGTLMIGRNAEKVCRLRVFASMKVSAREKTVFDIDNDGIRQYIRDNSEVMTEEEDSRILALSTCAGADSVMRTAVFCYIED
ncbi:sortase B [Ruminococcus sp. YE71]|uniref:class B sortase n=1 Tax=unclassified Ruminococcus TaxID=2608920 RepID=UPI00088F8AE0|nr:MULTISPECIES: class B sortase [unclassified Ruminococcus]SDA19928.1 sortase B [Ruminococcus sp. YE78]SFW31612.1 sortase B [Ruminococcus sp. YE71]